MTSAAQPAEPTEQEAFPGTSKPGGAAVSVVIPVLNGSDVLPDQLEALTRQTYTGVWEVLVADNGSTDGTSEVAANFAPRLPSLRVLQADERPGPSHARNVGAREATGDLLLFCDADDVVSPGWIQAMVSASKETAVLAGCGVEARNPHSVDPSAHRDPPPTGFRFLPWNRASNIGVHRCTFESLDGFDEERLIGEDVDFCWRAQLAGHELRFVSDAFVAYRERSTLWTAMRRQFRFGRAAPGLYRDYGREGAVPLSLCWVASELVMTVLRLPRALLRRDMRGWLTRVSGSCGRLVGWFATGRAR